MANSVGTRPMILDTVTASPLLFNWIDITAIEFEGYALNTDNATVNDAAGHEVIRFSGKSDLSPVHVTGISKVQGIYLTVITSGRVVVYVK